MKTTTLALAVILATGPVTANHPRDVWQAHYDALTKAEQQALYREDRGPNGEILFSRMDWIKDLEESRPPVYTDEELWRQVEMDCEACDWPDDHASKRRYFERLKADQEEAQAEINEWIFNVMADDSGAYRIRFMKEGREARERVEADIALNQRERALRKAASEK